MTIENALNEILCELNYIKDNIVKLGPKRRVGNNFEKKISDAKRIYKKFKEILCNLPKAASNELVLICTAINECYHKILSYEEEDNSVFFDTVNNLSTVNMADEKFCLKTAVSLLPKMTGDETVTQELIDSIELYDSMLCDNGKKLLVNFVLKSRLTSGAKMRLSTSYGSVELLLRDMRTHLLTRKSDTALQSQLQTAKQGDRSVKEFGDEIEKLFVDLTISQANGDQAAYKVLQSVNERNAVKCFSNGLRSQKIGTIIAARNITELKDAIRVAEDETNSSSNQQVFSFGHRGRYNNNFRYSSRGYQGQNSGRHFSYRPMSQYQQQTHRDSYRGSNLMPASSYGAARSRGADASTRGSRYVRGNRARSNYRHLNHFTTNNDDENHNGTNASEEINNLNLGEFFRP